MLSCSHEAGVALPSVRVSWHAAEGEAAAEGGAAAQLQCSGGEALVAASTRELAARWDSPRYPVLPLFTYFINSTVEQPFRFPPKM